MKRCLSWFLPMALSACTVPAFADGNAAALEALVGGAEPVSDC